MAATAVLSSSCQYVSKELCTSKLTFLRVTRDAEKFRILMETRTLVPACAVSTKIIEEQRLFPDFYVIFYQIGAIPNPWQPQDIAWERVLIYTSTWCYSQL